MPQQPHLQAKRFHRQEEEGPRISGPQWIHHPKSSLNDNDRRHQQHQQRHGVGHRSLSRHSQSHSEQRDFGKSGRSKSIGGSAQQRQQTRHRHFHRGREEDGLGLGAERRKERRSAVDGDQAHERPRRPAASVENLDRRGRSRTRREVEKKKKEQHFAASDEFGRNNDMSLSGKIPTTNSSSFAQRLVLQRRREGGILYTSAVPVAASGTDLRSQPQDVWRDPRSQQQPPKKKRLTITKLPRPLKEGEEGAKSSSSVCPLHGPRIPGYPHGRPQEGGGGERKSMRGKENKLSDNVETSAREEGLEMQKEIIKVPKGEEGLVLNDVYYESLCPPRPSLALDRGYMSGSNCPIRQE